MPTHTEIREDAIASNRTEAAVTVAFFLHATGWDLARFDAMTRAQRLEIERICGVSLKRNPEAGRSAYTWGAIRMGLKTLLDIDRMNGLRGDALGEVRVLGVRPAEGGVSVTVGLPGSRTATVAMDTQGALDLAVRLTRAVQEGLARAAQ